MLSSYVWRHIHIRCSRCVQHIDRTVQRQYLARRALVPGAGARCRFRCGMVVRPALGHRSAGCVPGTDSTYRCVRSYVQRRGSRNLGIGKIMAWHSALSAERAGWCEPAVFGDLLDRDLDCIIDFVGGVFPRHHAKPTCAIRRGIDNHWYSRLIQHFRPSMGFVMAAFLWRSRHPVCMGVAASYQWIIESVHSYAYRSNHDRRHNILADGPGRVR